MHTVVLEALNKSVTLAVDLGTFRRPGDRAWPFIDVDEPPRVPAALRPPEVQRTAGGLPGRRGDGVTSTPPTGPSGIPPGADACCLLPCQRLRTDGGQRWGRDREGVGGGDGQ